jgi:regulator of nucleoside diphosphate kinase
MFKSDVCQLTTRDFTLLETMQDRWPCNDEMMREILRVKLTNVIVMFWEDIPPTVVTLDSQVTYRINGGPMETRVVADNAMRGLVGLTVISITSPRGLAMLGLAEGQSVVLQRPGGASETITIEKVLYQPEAAKRDRTTTPVVSDLARAK